MADPDPESNQAEVSPWALFARLDFFFLWSSGVAMTVSMLLRTLISAQWLYDTTGSAAQLGLLGAVQFVQLPMALYGGALADRIDRKKLMVLTQVVGTLLLVILTLLAASNTLQPWHIFAVTGISSMVNTLGSSARPAMLPKVVSRSLLMHAVTTLNVTSQLATVIGPILFWPLYEQLGITMSFGISTGISLLSVVLPLLIRASGKPDITSRQSTWTSLKEGTLFVMRHPLLPGIFFLDLGVTVVSFYRQLFPVFADQLYGLGASGTGLLNTANAIGGIIGTFAVFYAGKFSRKGVLVLAATLVYAVFLIAFGLNRSFPVGLVIVGILGMTDSMTVTIRQAIVQLTTPDQLLGRAASIRTFAAMSANNIGQVEVGMLSAIIGAGQTMFIGGMLSVFFVVIVWRFLPSIRRYRYDNN
ncbi:MAG: MFS transporter [Chloroflexota bacterium]